MLQAEASAPAPAAAAAQVAVDEVVRVGQDEFHDALDSALESASTSGSQPDLGEGSCSTEMDLYHMFLWMYA